MKGDGATSRPRVRQATPQRATFSCALEALIETVTRGNPTEVKGGDVRRRWHAMSRFLPVLGVSVWLLLALTWLTAAGDFLSGS